MNNSGRNLNRVTLLAVAIGMLLGLPSQALAEETVSWKQLRGTDLPGAGRSVTEPEQIFVTSYAPYTPDSLSGKYRGGVKRNGWKCSVVVGWEFYRTKCRKRDMFFRAEGGA